MAKAPDKKKTLADYFAALYEKLGLKDELEPNELAIIADFHFYNLEFAKDELLLPDNKAALLMNLLASFISFKHLEKGNEARESGLEPGTEIKELQERRFELFKETLLAFAIDNPPSSLKVFSAEELKKIVDYALKTYFRHFELFTYAFSLKQSVMDKKMTLHVDEPIPVPPLKDSAVVQKEKEVTPY